MKAIALFFLAFCCSFLALAKDTKKTKSPEIKTEMQTATFAGGCFWGMEQFFRQVPGVTETVVGYTGGTMKNPTYEDVSEGKTGHAESVQISFDPKKVTYEKLLDLFFKMHDPTTKDRQGNDRGTQYRSAIFYQNDEQKKIATDFIAKVEKSNAWKAPITTQVAPAGSFYKAEEEHQKYLIKHPNGYDNHRLRTISFDK